MDFLDRLVERQRNPLSGVRPELPSRYEPVADGLAEVEQLAVSERRTDGPAPARSALVVERRVVESRVVPAPEPDRAARERPAEDPPRPQQPAPLAASEVPTPTVSRSLPDDEPPRAAERRPAETPARHEPPPAVRRPVEDHHRIAEETRSAAALPAPMLPAPPSAEPAAPIASDLAERPERSSSRPTVSISIGRIEIRPPESARAESRTRLEAPVTPQRSAYRPRLSLEAYLERPNRGRS